MHDVRYALRSIRKNPGYAAIVIATLGLGLGATTALFNVADATMLAPVPFAGSDRVMHLYDRQPAFEFASVSWPEMKDWRTTSRTLDMMAGEFFKAMSWRGAGEAERVNAAFVSEGYLQIFATGAKAGRVFSAKEHAPGGAPVAMLGEGFWQRAYGGDKGIIGRTVTLSGEVYTVIGVVADGGANLTRGPRDVWIPIEPRLPQDGRGEHYLTVYGRLAPGVTFGQARAELDNLGVVLDAEQSGHRIGIRTLREAMFGKAQGRVLVVFFSALAVLLIAAANIASLMLARMSGRGHELGVRAALGATRGRLVRQLLTESLILSLAGGALGLLIAMWGKDVLLSLWPTGAPKPAVDAFDVRSLLFTFGAAVLVGVMVGIAPALRGARADLAGSLRAGAVPRTGILRSVLVVVQHALAIVLLVGAALFGKSLVQLLAQKPGFDPQGVITMNISPAGAKYPDKEHVRQLYETIVDRLRTMPGAVSASAISNIPFGRSNTGGTFQIEGRPEFPSNNRPQATKFVVDGDFFRTMRIPLLQGRTFTTADKDVKIIINKTFAERYFPGESPLGKRMDVWGGFAEIVGVVGDIRKNGLDDPPELQAYINLAIPMPWTSFVIRASGDPTKLFAAAKAQVFSVDPDQPVYSVSTIDDMIAQSASSRRGLTSLVGAFAAVALLLSALGVYGVLSYSVSQRTREIGVRMALGAQSHSVLRLILVQGMRLAGIGAALGLILAVVLAVLLRSFFFEVSPTDPVVYAVVAAVLLAVGTLACFVPARRAARLDPMTVLRRD